MPPTLAEKLESQETADSYDDLEKFIQGMGQINEVEELNSSTVSDSAAPTATPKQKNLVSSATDSTNVSPVILAPLLSTETPQTVEKESIKPVPISTGRSMSKEFDDSEFLESVMNQLGVDFDDDDNLDLDNFKLQRDDKDEVALNSKKDGKEQSIEELLFDDLP